MEVHPDGLQSAGSDPQLQTKYSGPVQYIYIYIYIQSITSTSQVELNYQFLLQLYASFGACGIPPMMMFKETEVVYTSILGKVELNIEGW